MGSPIAGWLAGQMGALAPAGVAMWVLGLLVCLTPVWRVE